MVLCCLYGILTKCFLCFASGVCLEQLCCWDKRVYWAPRCCFFDDFLFSWRIALTLYEYGRHEKWGHHIVIATWKLAGVEVRKRPIMLPTGLLVMLMLVHLCSFWAQFGTESDRKWILQLHISFSDSQINSSNHLISPFDLHSFTLHDSIYCWVIIISPCLIKWHPNILWVWLRRPFSWSCDL